MPITPFHFGPGLLGKSLAIRRLSFTGFVASQIVIDAETATNILRHHWPAHGPFHSLLGGTAVGVATAALTWLAIKPLRKSIEKFRPSSPALKDAVDSDLTLDAMLLGGAFGGASHSIIDGAMHFDVHPFWPFSKAQPWFGYISGGSVMIVCVICAILGLMILWANLGTKRTTETEPT
ncbi:MAG TPA: hypothetical protein VFV19_09680 [Candidatus Polarisedimenticolaceae bacterium]|nr:hypothetical protein [Candidatus Polarisedimenticolaceae bacterium]